MDAIFFCPDKAKNATVNGSYFSLGTLINFFRYERVSGFLHSKLLFVGINALPFSQRPIFFTSKGSSWSNWSLNCQFEWADEKYWQNRAWVYMQYT